MVAQPIRVAILDDDAAVRTALARLLKAEGMVVVSYDAGDQFFEALAHEIPHLLILDFEMPGMNGLEILKYLGQRQFRIPTIVLTGHDEMGLRSDCLNAGAIAYLNKPLNPEYLIQTIKGISEASNIATLPHFG